MPALKERLLEGARWLAWSTGVLRAQHRRRHAETLTVFGAHRVLRRDDCRWAAAMPEWTVSDVTFRSALEFIAREYNVVSMPDVVAALREGAPLPPRAALISFDDGWSDTADTAAPMLKAMGLPAVVFVISGLVGSHHGTWESEWYAALQRADAERLREVQRQHLPNSPVDLQSEAGLEVLCRALRRNPVARRFALIEEHFGGLVDCGQRQMVNADDLVALVSQGVDVGAHTVSHDPLVGLPKAEAEIRGSVDALRTLLAPAGAKVESFSFPHGSYDAALVRAAVAAGAAACFTSDLGLVSAPKGVPNGLVMGRLWIGRALAAADGRLVPHRAAWRFFRSDVLPASNITSTVPR